MSYGIMTFEQAMPITEEWIDQAVEMIEEKTVRGNTKYVKADVEEWISDCEWLYYVNEDDVDSIDMDNFLVKLSQIVEEKIKWFYEEQGD